MFVHFLKSSAFFTLIILTTFVYSLQLFTMRIFCFIRGKKYSSDSAHNTAIMWGRTLFRSVPGWQVKIIGKENLPKPKEACVLIANHESATDILAIYFLGIQFRWLAKKELFAFPVIGTAMKWAGYIPIKRGNKNSHQHALELCTKCLSEKTPVLFFPEGTRSLSGHPKDFKLGAFKLSMKNNTPISPIALKGAGTLLKKNSLAPNSATVLVSILPTMFPKDYDTAEEYCRAAHKIICREHAKLSEDTF